MITICFEFNIQVIENGKKESARVVVKRLITEDGWKGLYRGLGPRFVSMSAWGTSMILAYEYLSMNFLLFHIIYMFNSFP